MDEAKQMNTPTLEQHAAIAAIHQRAANENPSSGWTDIAVLTAMEYADGWRETVQLQREEIAERTRERDEALCLVEEGSRSGLF